jgi:hypothetical protein
MEGETPVLRELEVVALQLLDGQNGPRREAGKPVLAEDVAD